MADDGSDAISKPVAHKISGMGGKVKFTVEDACFPAENLNGSSRSHTALINNSDPSNQMSSARPIASKKSASVLFRQVSKLSNNSVRDTQDGELALYEMEGDDAEYAPEDQETTLSAYLRSFTMPGTLDKEARPSRRKAKLGTVLGVYLPTIQHIFGIIMFLRLYWIVGSSGVLQAFFMVFMCCLCTFLTSFSMSAIATNGIVESGGSYFMISRNLGPEFGSAVGILFYLANAVAVAMYLIGASEIMLKFIAPQLVLFGEHDEIWNSSRVYGTLLLLIEFAIVALGVRFVQLFAPISLFCVIVSIAAIFAGGFAANVDNSPKVCLVGERLLRYDAFTLYGRAECHKNLTCGNTSCPLIRHYCNATGRSSLEEAECDAAFRAEPVRFVPAMPGIASGVIWDNVMPRYMKAGEATPGVKGNKRREVVQDLTTTFFVLLAIYFPSVTGIMTGSNMSGDLKDPQKSIPTGTIAAQLTTSIVYLCYVLVFGATIIPPVLLDKSGDSMGGGGIPGAREMVVAKLAWPNKWVLLVGSFTSTFGAALQCLCSAPRLLHSIAKDNVIPVLGLFSPVNKRNEPIRALVITTLIAECGILIGNIDHIAPIVDFFFLMCYAFVNIVCAFQTLLGAPNWRPRFRYYHWTLSVLGALLCFVIMFLTHWYYAITVIVLCALVYKYVEIRGAKKEWGDGIRGLALSTAQYSLLRIEEKDPHPKNWRPQLMVLMKPTEDHLSPKYERMVSLASQLKKGQGLTIALSLIQGDLANEADVERSKLLNEIVKGVMKRERLRGFSNVVLCEHFWHSVNTLIQTCGIGGLRPNTVMVGWPYGWRDNATDNIESEYVKFLDSVHRVSVGKRCLLMPKGIDSFPGVEERIRGNIDVWWIIHDGGLLILLPFLLKQHKVWRHCQLRVFAVAQMQDNSVKMKHDLEHWCYHLRIDARVEIVELNDSAISAYTYEKTLVMQERSQFIRELQLSVREESKEPQLLMDYTRSGGDLERPTSSVSLISVSASKISPPKNLFKKFSVVRKSSSKSKLPKSSLPVRRRKMSEDIVGHLNRASLKKVGFRDNPTDPQIIVSDEADDSSDSKLTANEKAPVVSLFEQAMSSDDIPAFDAESTSPSPPSQKLNIPGSNKPPSLLVNGNDTAHKDDNLTPTPTSDGDVTSPPAAAAGGSSLSGSTSSGLAVAPAVDQSQYTFTPQTLREELRRAVERERSLGEIPNSSFVNRISNQIDRRAVKKMHTAIQLNSVIVDRSGKSELVVLNLPRPPKNRAGFYNYLEYIEVLTEGLDRVLLVRGSGKEVITIYS